MVPEDPLFLRLWRRVWKSRTPLKIRIFVWLLLRQQLMTISFRQRMAPESAGDCVLCGVNLENCEHLFVLCPISQAVGWPHVVGRFLAIHWRRSIPESSRVATHICYATVYLDQPKRCHILGMNPRGRCYSA